MQRKNNSLSIYQALSIGPLNMSLAASPVAIGSAVAYADDKFMIFEATACLLGALFLLKGASLFHAGAAYEAAVDKKNRKVLKDSSEDFRGHSMVKSIVMVSFLVAGVSYLYLSLAGGVFIVIIGIVSTIIVLGCRGRPFPFAHGLLSGELLVLIFLGLVVSGTYYVQAESLTTRVFIAILPTGLLLIATMIVGNLQTIDRDRKEGSRTLVVVLGRYKSIVGYKMMLVASYLIPVTLAASGRSGAFILLPFCTVPMARALYLKVECDLDSNLNALCGGTARLSLVFSLMLSFGFVYHI